MCKNRHTRFEITILWFYPVSLKSFLPRVLHERWCSPVAISNSVFMFLILDEILICITRNRCKLLLISLAYPEFRRVKFTSLGITIGSNNMYPLSFKIVLAGDEAVGKTSLARRFVDEKFNESYLPTLGFEISVKNTKINGRPIIFSIWDIGGQQCFAPMRRQYYNASHGFLLVFNLSNRVTFKNLENWIVDIRATCPSASIVLVAAKADIQPWKVTPEEIDLECKKLGAACSIVTSAKTGEGVLESFSTLGKIIIQNLGFNKVNRLENPPAI